MRAALTAALLALATVGCTLEVSSGTDDPYPTIPSTTVATQPQDVAPAPVTTTTGQQGVLAPPACITEATGQLEGEACQAIIPTFVDPTPQP